MFFVNIWMWNAPFYLQPDALILWWDRFFSWAVHSASYCRLNSSTQFLLLLWGSRWYKYAWRPCCLSYIRRYAQPLPWKLISSDWRFSVHRSTGGFWRLFHALRLSCHTSRYCRPDRYKHCRHRVSGLCLHDRWALKVPGNHEQTHYWQYRCWWVLCPYQLWYDFCNHKKATYSF